MMPVVAEGGRERLRIKADHLLLVEGRDEDNLFDAFLKHRFGDEMRQKIQIIVAGGKDQFPRNLRAIAAAGRTRPAFRSIGVVRDADNDAGDAFASVCQALRNVDYTPPSAHGRFSDAEPAIGVFIVPDGAESGAIETLCRRSCERDSISRCVEEYLDCLVEQKVMDSTNVDKSFTHAYLAATSNPVARVGEGALRNVWNFESEAFSDLSGFLRNLVEPAPSAQP